MENYEASTDSPDEAASNFFLFPSLKKSINVIKKNCIGMVQLLRPLGLNWMAW